MMVSFVYTVPCPSCPTVGEGVVVATVRVNKTALRVVGESLGFLPRACKACGAELPAEATRARIHPDDVPKVNAARARKGWAPLRDPDRPDHPAANPTS